MKWPWRTREREDLTFFSEDIDAGLILAMNEAGNKTGLLTVIALLLLEQRKL